MIQKMDGGKEEGLKYMHWYSASGSIMCCSVKQIESSPELVF